MAVCHFALILVLIYRLSTFCSVSHVALSDSGDPLGFLCLLKCQGRDVYNYNTATTLEHFR